MNIIVTHIIVLSTTYVQMIHVLNGAVIVWGIHGATAMEITVQPIALLIVSNAIVMDI